MKQAQKNMQVINNFEGNKNIKYFVREKKEKVL
jgi:hypothetical protein